MDIVYNGLSSTNKYITITFETKNRHHYVNISINEIINRQEQIKEAIELAQRSVKTELKVLEAMNGEIGLIWSYSSFQLALLGGDQTVSISRRLNDKMISFMFNI